MMTLWAGRLTPAASVLVVHSTLIAPCRIRTRTKTKTKTDEERDEEQEGDEEQE